MSNCCSCAGYHEMDLDWLINQIKIALQEWDVTKHDWEETKQYITDYFKNLDVQEEINNKLDELIENGTISQLLTEIIGTDAMPIFVDSINNMTDKTKLYVLSTDGYIYKYSGGSFVSTGLHYGDIENVFYYAGAVPDNTDLKENDLKPGIYNLNSSYTYINLPENYNITYGGVYIIFNNSSYLNCWLFENYTLNLYTLFAQSTMPSKWGVYKDSDSYFNFKGLIPNETNLLSNELSIGYYGIGSISTVTGLPENFNIQSGGTYFIFRNEAYLVAMLIEHATNNIYTCYYYKGVGTATWFNHSKNNIFNSNKITIIGDSIGAPTTYDRYPVLLEKCGAIVQNLCVGSTGFCYPNEENNYESRINQISSDSETIFITPSFNDLASTIPIGDGKNPQENTIAYYVNKFFDSLQNLFPTKKVVCLTTNNWSVWRYGVTSKATSYIDMCKDVCDSKNIPFYLNTVPLFPWIQENNEEYFNNADGTHPNTKGQKILFNSILKCFTENCNIF